jgi:aspartyl-tRNA(Asn)/glutamyl-tRNA(Gln) amidotransferase subunit A
MADYDAIIGPTTPTTARPIGEKIDDPIAMYLADIYTVTANLVAAPAISLPAGMIDGLPCGLQLMGAIGQDEALLDIAQMVSDHISKP